MQKHEIPYSTATWGIVEDASELAPVLSVVATRDCKGTRTFALIEHQSLEKQITEFPILRPHGAL